MAEGHSPELDDLRRLLFPGLPADEGWARIDEALASAQDDERMARIEELADRELTADLVEALRRLRASSKR